MPSRITGQPGSSPVRRCPGSPSRQGSTLLDRAGRGARQGLDPSGGGFQVLWRKAVLKRDEKRAKRLVAMLRNHIRWAACQRGQRQALVGHNDVRSGVGCTAIDPATWEAHTHALARTGDHAAMQPRAGCFGAGSSAPRAIGGSMGYRPQAALLILFTTILFVALSVGELGRAAGPERPFKAYALLMARDEPAPAPSGTGTPLATAVGVPVGTATSATFGAAGGVLSTPQSKLVLTIPAGALASDTAISIQPLTNMAPGRIGPAYRLTPNGQTFLKPITLTFAYTEEDLVGTSVDFLGAAFQTVGGYWQWVGDATVDTTAKTASVSITHFTDVSLTAGLQIFPASKTVLTNGSVGLQVRICYDPNLATLGPGGASVGLDCDSQQGIVGTLSIDEWSVNGRPGGGNVFGTVSGSGATATYTAPSTEPIPNPVAVSARVRNPNKGASAKTLVSSVITIRPALLSPPTPTR